MTEPHEVEVEVEVVFDELTTSVPSATSPAGFASLYAEEFVPMVRLATLMCGSSETARDVVQDAFVKVHVAWPRLREPGAYLRRCVVNGCRSQGRWEKRRRGRPSTTEDFVPPAHRELDDALLSLPHRQRAALVLRFYEGRTENEIAELLGCRPGTVGPLVHRGLAELRKVIDL